MSWILGIDTSSVDLGIGLFHDKEPFLSLSRFIRNSHAEQITHSSQFIIDAAGIKPADISSIAITTGPGSFTGLRIGIAFVKGFCIARTIQVLPVSSLHVMAYSYRNLNRRLHSVIDARNGDVYAATFESSNGHLTRVLDDTLMSFDNFRKSVCPDDIIVTDTMGYARSTVFLNLEHTGVYPVELYPVQRGLNCASIGVESLESQDLWRSADDILPNYLRPSAAQQKSGTRNAL